METSTNRSDVIAVETHSSPSWGLIILLAALGPAISVALVPSAPARVALAAVAVIGLGAFAMAWAGFQYRFLRHGVEIRTLGFRLRTISKQAILGYSIEPWTLLRGYGIRGIGNTRAYVWGSKVVHIKTTSGEVFLGHSDPERIIRDLDRMTGLLASGSMQPIPNFSVDHAEREDSAGNDWYKTLVWLMWLALPATALNYWRAWDQLPYRMAVHFDAKWQPNGYDSREGALMMGLGITVFMLAVFTVSALIIRAQKPSPAWTMLAVFYVALGVLCYANYSIVKFNLHDQPAHSELVGSPSLATSDSDRQTISNLHS